MQSFAEFIKRYFEEQNITYNSASKMCGIDRTILGRYANGSRRPQSKEMVFKLAEGLQMSDENAIRMYNAYKRTKISEEFHTNYETIMEVVAGKHYSGTSKEDKIEKQMVVLEESAENLHTKEAILDYIRYIRGNAAFMKLKFNPKWFGENEDFQDIFVNAIEECPIEQIISLDGVKWQQSEGKMKNLSYLLPFLLAGKNRQVYYYYQRKPATIEDSSKANYVMSDKGIVFFDNGLTRGFFSNQKIPCDCYLELFEGMKSKCRLFADSREIRESSMEDRDTFFEKKEAGVMFSGRKKKNYICRTENEGNSAVYIREVEVVQLLWEFIWGRNE